MRKSNRKSPDPSFSLVPPLRLLEGDVVAGASSASHRSGQLEPTELIEDYLDHLCAPLVGVVPFRERYRLRLEAGDHLERLAGAYAVEGMPYGDAVRRAVHKYGTTREVTEQFLEAWFTHQAHGPLARCIGLANARAMACFGAATFLATSLAQACVLFPDPHPVLFGLSLADVRHIIPEPLPLIDVSPPSLSLALVTLLTPVAAGWATGILVPVRPARAVYQVQVVLTLYTFVLGMLMLPMRDGLLLGLIQLFYWIPAGCLTAHVSAVLHWRRRCLRPRDPDHGE